MTTILDPDAAPANELAGMYPERWEVETALDELKTHQRGPRVVLRSKTPDGVRQEAWGYLYTHYAIRALMATAAADHDAPTASASPAARASAGAPASVPPTTPRPSRCPPPSPRSPASPSQPDACARPPRVVKRKMSNYGVKRPAHRDWPQPALTPEAAIHTISP